MTIDFARVLRRRKPERRTDQFALRAPGDLIEAQETPTSQVALVPDTTVYIHDAAGTLPPQVAALVDRALLFHCSVCLSELAMGVSNADPRHPRWEAMRDHYVDLLDTVPATRVLVPDEDVWLDAGVLAGTLARTQGLQRHQRKEMLNDALIALTAACHGLPVLTANRGEFDLIQQLAPDIAFYFYSQTT